MSKQIAHRFDLPKEIPIYIGRQDFVVEYAVGKDVLHLGCVDEGLIELKQQKGLWLHERIFKVANSLWGVDIDENGLERMRAQGYPNLFLADIENLSSVPEIFQKEFNLVLLTEVIEHLNNPGKLLSNLKPLFRPDTEMLITVPNATSLANILENLRGGELVHPDHNYWFSLRTLQSLLGKYGFGVCWVGVYSQHDYHRSISRYLLNRSLRFLGIRPSNVEHIVQPRFGNNSQISKKPNLKAWIDATLTTISYRLLITNRPFFADGLILIVKPVAQNQNENNFE